MDGISSLIVTFATYILIRDYLTGVQMQGYALLGAALNVRGHHQAVHALLDVAMERLKEQEKTMGGRFNDW